MKEAFGMAVWGRRRREFREMGSLSITYSQRQCEKINQNVIDIRFVSNFFFLFLFSNLKVLVFLFRTGISFSAEIQYLL